MKIDATNPQKITIGPARFSWMNVFSPRKREKNGKTVEEYGITLLIPKEPNQFCKDPQAELDGIRSAIRAAAETRWTIEEKNGDMIAKWKHQGKDRSAILAVPLKDGDAEKDGSGDPRQPGYWYIGGKAFTTDPQGNPKLGPVVRDGQGHPISAHSGFVSGDWGKAIFYFAPYDTDGNQGVTCYINAVQCLYKDEPFGGGGDSFDVVEDAVAVSASPEDDPFADE